MGVLIGLIATQRIPAPAGVRVGGAYWTYSHAADPCARRCVQMLVLVVVLKQSGSLRRQVRVFQLWLFAGFRGFGVVLPEDFLGGLVGGGLGLVL